MVEAYCPNCDKGTDFHYIKQIKEVDLYKCESCGNEILRNQLVDNSLEMAIIRYLERVCNDN